MPIAIICEIRAGAMPKLKELRARHLEYISEHLEEILFGGPARDGEGMPQTMIIVLKTDRLAEAEQFIEREPYTASKAVFAEVSVRTWSQVVPPLSPDALPDAIWKKRSQ